MILVVMAFFKSGIDTEPAALQSDFNEHLGQWNQPLRLAGALRDAQGNRIGFMDVLEVDSFQQAESYIQNSPYMTAGLYDRVEIAEYAIEVGALR